MSDVQLRNIIEAALLAAGRPLTLADLGNLYDESSRPATTEFREALELLDKDYAERAIEVKETALGFRIQVRAGFSSEISRLWPERPQKYSRALLETLALVAYRQPITRAEIESVRGVAVNPNILKTLQERGWVRVVGHRDVPGHPELLGTTREFLDYFGLKSLDQMPALAELKSLAELNLQMDLPVPNATVEAAAAVEVEAGAATVEAVAGESNVAAEGVTDASTPGTELAGEGDDPVLVAQVSVAQDDDSAEDEDELSADGEVSPSLVAGPVDHDR